MFMRYGILGSMVLLTFGVICDSRAGAGIEEGQGVSSFVPVKEALKAGDIDGAVAFAEEITDFADRAMAFMSIAEDQVENGNITGAMVIVQRVLANVDKIKDPHTKNSTLSVILLGALIQDDVEKTMEVEGQLLEQVQKCFREGRPWGQCYNLMPHVLNDPSQRVGDHFDGFHKDLFRDDIKIRSIWVPSPAEIFLYRYQHGHRHH